MKNPEVLVSIHDVMPETLTAVSELVTTLGDRGWKRLRLLVVPGREWRDSEIELLHQWQRAGHLLAGHGWHHRVDTRQLRAPLAKLHSLLISRDVAEHLALDANGILALMIRCHRWFVVQGLTAPDYYVPPAWAMGRVPRSRLHATPFRKIEYLSGIYDVTTKRFARLPVVGFEADTVLRGISLRLWNGVNRRLMRPGHPLRLAIHPYDPKLKLARDLDNCLLRFRCTGEA